jgi:non-ribosomal peptide synthase protein (TIGR01720 family)
VGQVDYCAANAFMDAYATTACRGQSETMTVSVNWDTWADDVHDVYHHDFSQSLSTREGGEVFRRILGHNRLPQIAVCTRHLPTLIQRTDELMQVRLLDEAAQVETSETKHPRPHLQSTYVAPRNDIEEKLAVIWQQLLGIAQVGVHDNFFELGGDSLLEIQVVARARDAGLHISSEQLFQRQTIAGLARALQPTSVAEGEVELPLTPYQQLLLARGVHEPHVVVLEPEQRLDPEILGQAIVLVCALYDALRLRFMPGDEGHWRQVFQDQPSAGTVATMDLATLRSDEYDEAIIAEVTRLRRGFGAAVPPLLRAVYLQLGAGHPDRLLLAVTPLSADTAALPILIKDLYTAYQQVAQAIDVPLPPPTAMFADWVARVTEYARSGEPQAQREYWRHIANQGIHPDRGASGTIQVVATRLAPEQTRQLLELPEIYYLQPEEAILTALALVLARWCGYNTLLVGLGHDQRVDTFTDVDTSRIVGCLRTEYPLHLDISATDDLDAVLKGVKEQVRGVPHYGLGYSFLRTAAEIPVIQPQVTFSYHPPLSDCPFFRVVDAHISDDAGLYRRTDVPMHLSAGVINGQLRLDWTYNAGLYRRATMTRLSHNLVAALQTLILHCHESSAVPFASSDFPEAGLDQKELDQFIARLVKKPNAPAGPRPQLP